MSDCASLSLKQQLNDQAATNAAPPEEQEVSNEDVYANVSSPSQATPELEHTAGFTEAPKLADGPEQEKSPDQEESPEQHAVLLEWQVPHYRENNLPLALNEIKGYEISYGPSPANLHQQIRIQGALRTQHTVESLSPGDHYFTIATIDIDDHMSRPSKPIHLELR